MLLIILNLTAWKIPNRRYRSELNRCTPPHQCGPGQSQWTAGLESGELNRRGLSAGKCYAVKLPERLAVRRRDFVERPVRLRIWADDAPGLEGTPALLSAVTV